MGHLTVELRDDVLRRVKTQAAASSRSPEDFVSDLVAREVLLWDEAWEVFDAARTTADLTEEEAVDFALREVRNIRDGRAHPEAPDSPRGARHRRPGQRRSDEEPD